MNTIRVLLIEDDPVDRILLEEMLYQTLPSFRNPPHYAIDWVQSLADGVYLHQQAPFHVILADLNLKDSRGLATIDQLTAAVNDAPIVLLTSFVDDQLTFNAARYGIQDYLVKGEFEGMLLLRTLHFAIDRFRLERRQAALARIELVSQEPDELQPLIQYVVDTVAELLPTSANVALFFHDPASHTVTFGAATPQASHLVDPGIEEMFRRIIAHGESEAVANVAESPLPEIRALTAHDVYAYIGVPVLNGARCLGVLCALENRVRTYTKADVDFMRALANRTGAAIHRVELYERLRAQAHDLAVHNAELDAFSHTVAHDLRNLLTSVIGYAEMLSDDYEELSSEDRARYLEAIITRGDKMQQVIDSLLTLARLRTLDIEMETFDMGNVVKETLHRLQEMVMKYRASVHVLGQWPQAIGHAGWIEEVWVNYVTNALKYGGTPPSVTLGATDQGESVRFWVKDNGYGLNQDEQQRLFEPFVRLHPTRADGHGLGLSIVRRIVEKCNGRVGIESTPGDGSTFWFELPTYKLSPPSALTT